MLEYFGFYDTTTTRRSPDPDPGSDPTDAVPDASRRCKPDAPSEGVPREAVRRPGPVHRSRWD